MNKAKDKAKELFDNYVECFATTLKVSPNGMNVRKISRKCALIAVNETIKSHENYSPKMSNISDVSHTLDFWYGVKNELEIK